MYQTASITVCNFGGSLQGVGKIFLADLGPKSMALSLASIKSDSVRGMLEDEKQRLQAGVGLSMDAAQCFLQDVRKLLVR